MRRVSVCLFGFLTAILLFFASFAVLIETSAFSGRFYKTAFERLGTYGRIAELAENPVREFTARMAPPDATGDISATAAGTDVTRPQILLGSIVEENISDKMVRLNVDALIDGLVSYFRGETNSLPDLYLTGSAALNSINVQVLIMYLGENRLSAILHLISLFQFVLVHLPAIILLPFPVILAYMLCKNPGEIYSWLCNTAFFYCVMSFAAGLLLQVLPYSFANTLLAGIISSQPPLAELLSVHIAYFANVLTASVMLSGTLFYAGIKAFGSINFHPGVELNYHTIRPYNRVFAMHFTILLLSAIFLYTNFQLASADYYNRNLGHSLSLVWESNPISRVTDARADLVYLLEIHLQESETNKPVSNVGIHIAGGISAGGFQTVSCLTGDDGTASFILGQGAYTMTLDTYNVFPGYDDTQTFSYEFEMQTPGRSVLTVALGKKEDGLPYVENTSLQYIP